MSNVGQAVLTVVGTVVGAYFGNPELGMALGSLAGSALFPTQLPDGPKITDNRTTTASLGEPVPFGFGTFSVSGTFIYAGPIIESAVTSGKGGPEQKTFNYNQTIAIGLCEPCIDLEDAIGGVTRIWENGALVYDIRPQLQANTLTGDLAETDDEYANRQQASAAYAATFTLYTGTEDQLPDPSIESIEGVGNVGAYRALAYIVWPNRQLQVAQGLRHPNFQVECYQKGVTNCVTQVEASQSVLYPWDDGGPYEDPTNVRNVNTFQFINSDPSAPGGPLAGTIFNTAADAIAYAGTIYGQDLTKFQTYCTLDYETLIASIQSHAAALAPGDSSALTISQVPYTYAVQLRFNSKQVGPGAAPEGDYWEFTEICNPGPWYRAAGYEFWQYPGIHKVSAAPAADGGPQPDLIAPYIENKFVNCGGSIPASAWAYSSEDAVLNVMRAEGLPASPCEGLPDAPDPDYCMRPDGRWIKKANWVLSPIIANGWHVLQIGYQLGPNRLYPSLSPVILAADPQGTEEFWTTAYNAAVIAGTMPSGMIYQGDASGGTSRYPRQVSQVYQLNLEICEGQGAQTSVGDIIRKVCTRAGVVSVEASDMDSVFVDGYQISSLCSGASIIQPLRSVAFFDAVESATTLRFQSRGKPIVATLTDDDIGAYDISSGGATCPPKVKITRTMDTELPRQIRVHYIATQRDYQDGEKDSQFRLTTKAVDDQDIQLPFAIHDTQALQTANVLWAVQWAQRNAYEIAVDQSWAQLEEGDAIAIPIEGFFKRVLLTQDTDASGVLRTFQAVDDNSDSYTSTAVAPPSEFKPPIIPIIYLTRVEFLDLPALQDADNDAGFYIAAQRDLSSAGNHWTGCTISKSVDGGATFSIAFAITKEASIGVLYAPVAASQAFVWDDDTMIFVDVASDVFTFESRTDDAVLSGANAAAMGADGRWEIVQFANAELVSANRWKLSRLLRGRRGTEDVMGTSQAGDTFVLVSGGDLGRVALNTDEIGAARTYKAVSIGAAYATGVDSVFTGHAEALVCFSPVDVTVTQLTDGDLLIRWTRRDRLGRTLMSGVDMPLSDPPLQFQVDILDLSPSSPEHVIRSFTVNDAVQVTYTAAQIFADFASSLPESLRLAVYQMSPVLGRGTPALAIAPIGGTAPPPSFSTIMFTFGGSFVMGNDAEISVFVTWLPPSGAAVIERFDLLNSGYSSLDDFASDLVSQVNGGAIGAHVLAQVVGTNPLQATITSETGTVTAEYFSNSPIGTTTPVRPPIGVQAGAASYFYIDLWTLSGPSEMLAPASDPTNYAKTGDALMNLVVMAYDPIENGRISALQAPPVPAGLEEGDIYATGGFSVNVPFSAGLVTTSLGALENLPAALLASAALAPYRLGATLGQLTGTTPHVMPRAAVSITMKPGYYLATTDTPSAHPSGYHMVTNALQPGSAVYASGASQVAFVAFSDNFDNQTGDYFSVLETGQVYRVTLDGTDYTHTVLVGELADVRTDLGTTAYYRDAIYNDLATQITDDGNFTVQLSKFYRAPGGPDTWIYQMVLTRTTPDTAFTVAASVDFPVTLAIS